MNVPRLANALWIARVELRRSWRRMTGKTSKQLQLAILVLVVPLYSLAGAAGAFFLGALLADGDAPPSTPAFLGIGLLGVALFLAFFVINHALKTGGIDGREGLLTTVPYEDVVAGVVLATIGRVLAAVAAPIALVAGAFVVGSGAPLAGVSATLALLAVVVAGVTVGLSVAFLLKLLTAHSAFLTRHKSALAFAASLLIPAVWIAGTATPGVAAPLATALLDSPASWIGHLVIAPVPGTPVDPTRAAVAAIAVPAGLVASGALTIWLAGRLWYADPVQPDHAHRRPAERRFDVFSPLPGTASAVARKSLRRAKRAPFTVQFAVFPYFFLIFRLQDVFRHGRIPAGVPVELAIATAIMAGAAFSLNPLGGEEEVLPLTLTARVTGWEFVGGLALAGAVIGVPLAVALPVLAGIGAGIGPLSILAAVVTGLVLTVTAPGVASGFGAIFPKFERSTVGTDRDVVVPSTWAFVGYTALVLGLAVPAWIAGVPSVRGWMHEVTGVAEPLLAVGGLGVTTAFAAGAALVGYAYAANRVGDYQIE